ncbi:hypothetical protein GYMLUDRAFT_252994 [Collybiopsis luxurians FD-317 M1]|uniref:Uncharacterized protein n=1 Tax=Collybiopsis luxurians FD-317 M1 TaxID=944289 RepID=A0A0D0C6S3_9AGAR|nr:hypothetical protein GYMLUDRAFT_252994 [Collybiopsis luxurians FD-317 M1]
MYPSTLLAAKLLIFAQFLTSHFFLQEIIQPSFPEGHPLYYNRPSNRQYPIVTSTVLEPVKYRLWVDFAHVFQLKAHRLLSLHYPSAGVEATVDNTYSLFAPTTTWILELAQITVSYGGDIGYAVKVGAIWT